MSHEQNINRDFMMKLLCELHEDLERQGPGSTEITRKALGFLDNLDDKARGQIQAAEPADRQWFSHKIAVDALPAQSEGAIANIDFEKGLHYWRYFLK